MSTLHDSHDDEAQPTREPFAMTPEHVLYDLRLSDGAVRAYGVFDRFWRDKDECWPSQATLAEKLGVDVSVVRTRVRELEGAKLLRTRRRGQGHTNVYVRLRRPDLRLVKPIDEATERAPGTAERAEPRDPEREISRGLERVDPRDRTRRIERDALNETTATGTPTLPRRRAARVQALTDQEAEQALVDLVEHLEDADEGTLGVFRNAFADRTADDFTKALVVVEHMRFVPSFVDGVNPVESEAAYAFGILAARAMR